MPVNQEKDRALRKKKKKKEKDKNSLAEIRQIVLFRITPRRRPACTYRVCEAPRCTSQQRPPAALPAKPESPSAIAVCQSKIKWWENVRDWLQNMCNMIDESLGKDLKDLSVLSSGPEILRLGDGGYFCPPVPPNIVPCEIMQVPDGPRPSSEKIQEDQLWQVWHDEQLDLQTCNLDKKFYGPMFLPDIQNPSAKEMFTIREFFYSHKKYMVKHMDHLMYLLDLIEDKLIPQVDYKIKELIGELTWLERFPGLNKPERVEFVEGVIQDESSIDYPAPETEEDYPQQSDEEDQENIV